MLLCHGNKEPNNANLLDLEESLDGEQPEGAVSLNLGQ